VEETIFGSSIHQYMKKNSIDFTPEDIYFSKNMQDFFIGKVADYDSTFKISTESLINNDSFDGNKFCINDNHLENRMKTAFHYNEYLSKSDIRQYLKYIQLDDSYDKTHIRLNAFDVDLFFCNYVNNIIENYNDKNENDKKMVMEFIKKKGLRGYIYHPKQLKNIFQNIHIFHFLNKICIEYNLKIYDAKVFVNNFLNNMTYKELFEKLIQKKYENFNNNFSLLLLVFVGNEQIGYDLIRKIYNYKKIQEFNIGFCFNSKIIYNKFKSIIKNNFTYYSIYLSNELGTDITSTILMYDSIYRKYNFEHIIKLHTKSIKNQYNDLTNYLLNFPLIELLKKKNKNCNCIGHEKYYINLNDDLYNKVNLYEMSSFLNKKKCFVAGTIFYCPNKVFKETLEFMKKTNFRLYFFNNLYENNGINKNYSPIHFLERVFGTVHF
jgi:hypothetical protein